MKVSNILRYSVNIISFLISSFGVVFFILFYRSESFKTKYGEFDTQVIAITLIAFIITAICNLAILVIKCSKSDGNYSFKTFSGVWIGLFIIAAISAFILIADAVGIELGILFWNFAFYFLGNMVDFSEVKEVDTTYETWNNDNW